jgi:hypothetical protein
MATIDFAHEDISDLESPLEVVISWNPPVIATAQVILIKAFEKLVRRDVAKFEKFCENLYYLYGDPSRSSNLRRYEKTLGPGIFYRCWQAVIGLGTLEREPVRGEDGEPKPNVYTKAARLAK